MAVRVLALIAGLALIGLSLWGYWQARRKVPAAEKAARARQAQALRDAGWRENRDTGRWSHPTKTNGELLLSEAEMVEATGTDWPEELRR
jgi:uncharacterized protein HemX